MGRYRCLFNAVLRVLLIFYDSLYGSCRLRNMTWNVSATRQMHSQCLLLLSMLVEAVGRCPSSRGRGVVPSAWSKGPRLYRLTAGVWKACIRNKQTYILYEWNMAVIAKTDIVYDSCIGSYKTTTNHTWDNVVIVVLGEELWSLDMLYALGKKKMNMQ